MSFVLKQSDTYSWDVTLVLPAATGGKKEKSTFQAEFKRLPQSRINEIVRLAKRIEVGIADDDEFLEDQNAAREILCGWSGVVDDDNKEIKFNKTTLNQLLELPTVASQIVRVWFSSLDTAKRKNS
tara:strand:- start:2432 stop:2809 length:378 start_codon:yes stop_codon:yes gene_type:complete